MIALTCGSLFVSTGVAHADLCYNPITGQFEPCPSTTTPPPTNPPPTNPPPTNPPPTNPPPTNPPPQTTFPTTHTTPPPPPPLTTTPVTTAAPTPTSPATTDTTVPPVPTTACPPYFGKSCPNVSTTAPPATAAPPTAVSNGVAIHGLPAGTKHHFSKPFLGAMILDGLLLVGIAGYVLARRIRNV